MIRGTLRNALAQTSTHPALFSLRNTCVATHETLIFSLSECLQCAKQFLYFEEYLDSIKVGQKVA